MPDGRFEYLLISWDFHAQQSLEFTENVAQKHELKIEMSMHSCVQSTGISICHSHLINNISYMCIHLGPFYFNINGWHYLSSTRSIFTSPLPFPCSVHFLCPPNAHICTLWSLKGPIQCFMKCFKIITSKDRGS